LQRIVGILLIIILLPLGIFFWPSGLGGDTGFLIVQGNSMLPTILPGSMVIIKKQPAYQVDDIVSFTLSEGGASKNVVHRIIEETEEGFIIKGDNNPKQDIGIHKIDDINGKVIFATPYFGDLMLLIRNPLVLFITSVVVGVINWQQKQRRTNKEKLRRLRLGLPPENKRSGLQIRPKKQDYSFFLAAIGVNVLVYAIMQVSLSYNVRPDGDILTGFLYRIFETSFASTMAFGLYWGLIIALYFASKVYEQKVARKIIVSAKRSKSMMLIFGSNFNPVLIASQFVIIVFVLMSIFYMMELGTNLIEVVTCDPTKELC
jgi:signal peptidase